METDTTPSPNSGPVILPADAPEKLGFPLVLERLRSLLAARHSLSEDPTALRHSGAASAIDELNAVAEMQDCLQFDDPFVLGSFDDIRPVVGQLGPKGLALEGPDLRLVASASRSAAETIGYVQARTDQMPVLSRRLDDLDPRALPWQAIIGAVDESGDLMDNASPALARIRKGLASARSSARKAALDALKRASSDGFAADEQPTIRGGRMVIPVRAEAKRRIDGFVHDVSSSGQTVFIEPAASLESNNRVRELEHEEIRESHAIRVRLTEELREHKADLLAAHDALTVLDRAQAKARLANEMEAIVPNVGTEGVISIRGARNPELLEVFRREGSGRGVVPFALDMGTDTSMIVISGPNAGGKSVTMKGVGLMAVMLMHGLPIPVAPASRFDWFDGVFVDIGDEQSMADDVSTYTSHLRNLASMLAEAGESSLTLIDEAGTGTDPEAGGAMAQAVLEALHAKRVRTIVTTHYGPLKVFAHETDGVSNASMAFDQDALRPTYEFQVGVPGSSYAREIASRSGMPTDVIQRSLDLVESGAATAESLIKDLMDRNASLEGALEDAHAVRKELEARRDALELRLDNLQIERDRIRDEALRSADSIMREANRAVERTIREIKESKADKDVTRQARERLEHSKETVQKAVQKSERKQRSRSRKKKQATQSPASNQPISVGDRVRMDGGDTIGDVVEIAGKHAVVAFNSMQMKTELGRLVRVGGKAKQEVRVRQQSGGSSTLSVQAIKSRLDIRGKRADEAMSDIVPFVDRAMAAGASRLEVVHGKGTGALRSVLHDYLDTMSGHLRYEEAPITEGGAGVTRIFFD